MIDQKNSMDVVTSLVAAVRTADVNGTGVASSGASSVTHVLSVGVGGITFDASNRIDVIAEHSDDNSTYVACAATDVNADKGVTVTSGIVKSLAAAHAAAAAYSVGYRGSKPWSRLRLDFVGTHGTGTATAAIGVRGNLSLAPAVA